MGYKKKTIIMAVIAAALILFYLFFNLSGAIGYILSRRLTEIVAIVLTGGAIALASTIFMTITHNRILTPSVMGLDSLYLLVQTFSVFVFGSGSLIMMSNNLNFLVSVIMMVGFSLILYQWLLKGERNNIFFLLLIGVVLGTFFSSITEFMQVLMDPNEFMVAQDQMFASINNVNRDLLVVSIIIIGLVLLYFMRFYKYLDVLSLGRDQAINLGVPYNYIVKRLLVIVAILIAVATALIGPITFLGLLVVNVAYEVMKTFRHFYIIIGAVLASIIALVGGQLIVEEIFQFSTTISVIINFVGGIYFIYILLKGSKRW